MARFRFVHAADVFLDRPVAGVSCRSERVRDGLANASLDAFERLVEFTLAKDVTFLLITGGLYEGPHRGVRAQAKLLAGLRRLSEAGVDVLITDHLSLSGLFQRWGAGQKLPPGVTLINPEGPATLPIVRGDATLATLHTSPASLSEEASAFRARFASRAEGINLALLPLEHDAPRDLKALPPLTDTPMDYWALSGMAKRKMFHEKQPCIVLPGALQGRGFDASETGTKGAALVEVHGAKISRVSFVPLDSLRFFNVDLDVGGLESLHDLHDAVEREKDALKQAHLGVDVVARLFLYGQGPLRAHLQQLPGGVRALLADIQEADTTGPRFFHWEDVRDATQASFDRDAVAQRADLAAEILRLSSVLRGNTDALGHVLEGCLKPLRTPDLAPFVDGLTASKALELLEKAGVAAVEHFGLEEGA